MAIVFKRNYSASTAYSIDNIVRYTDGKTYISLANSNTGHTPGASGSESYWKELAGVKYNSDNPDLMVQYYIMIMLVDFVVM